MAFVPVALGFSTLRCWGITILNTQVGGPGTEVQDEQMGAFTGLSSPPLLPWYPPSARHCFEAGEGTDADMLFALCSVRYCMTPQAKNVSALSEPRITVVRRASYSVQVFPCTALLLVVTCLTDLACAHARIYNSVRQVKSRVVRGSPALVRGARELRRT